jgi:glycosyltransferase involved in cell wall biosynthesis
MNNLAQPGSTVKVAILLPSLPVGGVERLVLEELACLKEDPKFSFELHLVFEAGHFYGEAAGLGVPITVWHAPHKSVRMLATYLRIAWHLRRSGCDILHSHLLGSIGALVGKLAGAKVISTVHSDRSYTAVEKLVLARSDLVLGCGLQVVKRIGHFIPQGKIALLHNAIHKPGPPSGSREIVLEKLGVRSHARLLVSLGRLHRLKGFDVLIAAFREVAGLFPDAVLLIGGVGEESARLRQQIDSLGLSGRILLPGLVHNVHDLLAACDIYVNSSHWEGLPMTLLEAIAHGKPMVATDVGGNSEVVRDEVTGLLVPPDDPAALAKAMGRMLSDERLRTRASLAAKELFVKEYTIEPHCLKLTGYYRQVLWGRVTMQQATFEGNE